MAKGPRSPRSWVLLSDGKPSLLRVFGNTVGLFPAFPWIKDVFKAWRVPSAWGRGAMGHAELTPAPEQQLLLYHQKCTLSSCWRLNAAEMLLISPISTPARKNAPQHAPALGQGFMAPGRLVLVWAWGDHVSRDGCTEKPELDHVFPPSPALGGSVGLEVDGKGMERWFPP